MVDMDLFFLQICATQLPANFFLTTCIDTFGVNEWFNMGHLSSPQEMEHDSMLEGMLTFLATLVTSRTNLGNDEDMKCIIEISALLATSDKTHSQLLELMPERSGNVHTRNFEKYLKQLSIYRPPPVGSENLEQGLFMPLPVVWKVYYDPLHVLLRAVHRRDFQNSMDRFSAYVKQQKKMPKSGNLWPPFRLPNPVGKGYSNPACILDSKVFHSMLLGIFYRSVHVHNVSENLLALAVFLLEMAVSFSDKESKISSSIIECLPPHDRRSTGASSSTTFQNEQQPHPDTPELMNCYPSNFLMENLCLNVNRISLSPPEPQVSPANYNNQFDSDIEWELSESETMPMLIGSVDHDYTYHNVLDVALPQDLSIVRETSVANTSMDEDLSPVRATTLLPLMAPDSIQTVAQYRDLRSPPPLLPQTAQLALRSPPASLPTSGNLEIALRHDPMMNERPRRVASQEMFYPTASNTSGVILPFNRVQPVAVPSRALDIVPAANSSSSRRQNPNRRRHIEGGPIGASAESETIQIEESIISLLLKLHSQLSGTLDSFSLDDPDQDIMTDEEEEMAVTASEQVTNNSSQYPNLNEPRIGDGTFFIGNLLRKIAKSDENCAKNINEIRQKLWPNQRERQAEQKAREAKEKEERTKRAKERQQKLMEEFADRQKQFMASEGKMMEGIEEEEDEVMEEAREKEYDCIICNRTGPSHEANPIGLVVLVESSSIVGHRRKTTNRFPLPVCDEDKSIPGRNVRLSSEFTNRTELLHWKFGTQWFLTHNIGWEGGVHVQSCGHHVHLTCQDSYLKSLSPLRPQNLNVEHGEFSCPVCRQLANSVLPLSPQLDRPTLVIRNPTPEFGQLCTELMNLIKDSKRPNVSFLFKYTWK